MKQQLHEDLKSLSSKLQERTNLAAKKLSALKLSLSKFSSSVTYFEQREAKAKLRLFSSSNNLTRKKEELNGLELSRKEVTDALSKSKETETHLRKVSDSLRSKMEDENRKLEHERVLFTIDTLKIRNWHVTRAAALLKSEDEKTKLHIGLKLNREKLSTLKKEAEALIKKLGKIEIEIKALESEIEKETALTDQTKLKLESIVKEKEMAMENLENVKTDYEMTIVEYYEALFETELNEEELKIMHEEVLDGEMDMEGLQAARDEAVGRKMELFERLSGGQTELCVGD